MSDDPKDVEIEGKLNVKGPSFDEMYHTSFIIPLRDYFAAKAMQGII